MGHSPRTVEANQRRRQQQQWAELMTKAKPDSLTEGEVELSEYPLTKAPKSRPITAWVRCAGHPVKVRGFAWMWTERAVKIRWLTPLTVWHEAWVWEGAVVPRGMETGELNGQRLGLSVNAPRDD